MSRPRRENNSRKSYDPRRAFGSANYLNTVTGGGLTLPRAGLAMLIRRDPTTGELLPDSIGVSPKRYAKPTVSGTYFVDDISGNDGGAGNYAAPWKTVSKVNGRTFSAGDKILFRRGGVWREQLTAPSAGTGGNPIVFGSYGDNEDSPEITGANLATGFIATAIPYVFSASVSADPRIVLFEKVVGSKKGSLGALAADGDWYYSGGTLYVFFPYLPSDTAIEYSARAQAIYSRKNYVTIQDILAGNCQSSWAGPITCRNDGAAIIGNIIQGCTVKNGATAGIYLLNANGCQVLDNIVEDVWNGTIYTGGGDGVGIRFMDLEDFSTGNLVSRNLVKNAYVGMKLQAGVLNTELSFNRIITPLVNGIDLYRNPAAASPVSILNNTIHFRPMWDAGHGIDLQDTGSDGAIIKNNAIYCDFTGTNNNVELIYINPTPTNVNIDYNLYYLAPGCTASVGKLNTTKYATLAQWKTALAGTAYSGKDAHSIGSDPLFTSVSGQDFTIPAGSPCVGAGVSPFTNGVGDKHDADGYMVWSDFFDAAVYHARAAWFIGAYAPGGGAKVFNSPTIISGNSMADYVLQWPICPTLKDADDGTIYTGATPNQVSMATFVDSAWMRAGSKAIVAYSADQDAATISKIDRAIRNT